MKKNTQELLEILRNTGNIESYLNEYSESFVSASVSEYLTRLIKEKNISKSRCIADAGLQRNYGYQIFSGERTPLRDKVLALCIAMQLSVREVHELLCATGYPDLYPKNERDSIIIFALERGLTVTQTNELLYEMGEALIE